MLKRRPYGVIAALAVAGAIAALFAGPYGKSLAQAPTNALTSILSTDYIPVQRATSAYQNVASPDVLSTYVRSTSLLYTTTGTAGSTGTTAEQTLGSYTLAADTLASGTKLRIGASFTAAANTNTKTFKCYFGSSSISSGLLLTNGKNGDCQIIVTRVSAASHIFTAKMLVDTTNITDAVASNTDSDASDITIRFTATQGSPQANDVILNDFYVERLGS